MSGDGYHRPAVVLFADYSDFVATAEAVDRIIDRYNHQRLHSALSFLRPVDWYRGKPEALLAERRRRLFQTRELRKQENLQLRERLISWPKAPESSLISIGEMSH